MEPRNHDDGMLAAVCSNLEKACEKQIRPVQAKLFKELGTYYGKAMAPTEATSLLALNGLIQEDIEERYDAVSAYAGAVGDRGALRCTTWGKKVTAIHKSLLARFEKQGEAFLEGNNLYVCEACGFIAVATSVPEICPICKAPASRFTKI